MASFIFNKPMIINHFFLFKQFLCKICPALLLIVGLFSSSTFAAIHFDSLINLAGQQYGERAQKTMLELRTLFVALQNKQDHEKIRSVNEFINRKISVFDDDINIWGKPDYWATPLESLGRAAGDCEDYSIAKYLLLRELGIANAKLRLTYVRAQIGGPASKVFQAHMVLSYYQTPDTEPLILDNLITDIRPASRRTDLKPIFGFNSEDLWVGNASSSRGDSSAHLSRWRDLLERAKKEGIE